MSWKTLDIKGRNLSIKSFQNLGSHFFELEHENKKWISPKSFLGLSMFDYFGFKSIKSSLNNVGNKVYVECNALNYVIKNITNKVQTLTSCNAYSINGSVEYISKSHNNSGIISLYENGIKIASTSVGSSESYEKIEETAHNYISDSGDGYKLFRYFFSYISKSKDNKDIRIEVRGDNRNTWIESVSGYYFTDEINDTKPINHNIITIDNI